MEKKNIMKRRILTTLAAAAAMTAAASAQTVVYSLPSTTIHLEVKTVRSDYTPGPYAAYAKKYLGIEVPLSESSTFTLSDIKLTPCLEADRSSSYVINLDGLEDRASMLTFLEFSSQGLVMLSDADNGKENIWRFPSIAPGNADLASEATGNLTSTETVLYRSERNNEGEYERVAFKQSQVVEKSTEKKAQEAASTILYLRQQRINIITGNTDATFSGDALRAAVEEINRTEDMLMSLFTGRTDLSVQTEHFDVVPESTREDDIAVAFRISDTQGLLSANDISGRPIVIEITPENGIIEEETEQVIEETESRNRKARYEAAQRGDIVYRIPAICTVRIIDGQNQILRSRMPVYQKGQDLSFPVSVLIK